MHFTQIVQHMKACNACDVVVSYFGLRPHALKLLEMKSSPLASSGSYRVVWFHTPKVARNQVPVRSDMLNLPLHSI